MGQHRRRTPRRRRLRAALLPLTLSAVTVAVVLAGGRIPTARPAVSVAPPAPATAPSAAPSAVAAASPTAEPATPAATPSAGPTTGPTVEPSTDPTAGGDGTAAAVPEAARVGALFTGAVAPGHHFCTASVLHSPTGNLLLTAAHCLDDPAGVTFAPGYHDGTAPYGTWRVTRVHTTGGWSQDSDEDEDFAVLETAPSGGREVESVVGAGVLGTDEPFGTAVRLYGQPARTETVRVCTAVTGRHDAQQRVVDCPDYPGGTSGGPWISTATGHVIGVIGGYREGGDSPDTSYSPLFDDSVAALYAEAVAAAV